MVALGDSITDGVSSTVGGNDRWPNDLARRLDAAGRPTLAVADEGIGGNRLLTGRGAAGPARRRGSPGMSWTSPGSGTSSCWRGSTTSGSAWAQHLDTGLTPARIIAGYRDLIAQAHARGVRIFGATLLPYQGAGYYSPAGEAIREAVNAWIRTSGAFDGVIDFDAVMRDPATRCGSTPATTPVITCTPTTPATRPWQTPSICTCSCPARAMPLS